MMHNVMNSPNPSSSTGEALRERHMGYLQGLKWDHAVAKSPDSFRGFDIFKITEGSDPDSRNQEMPVSICSFVCPN